MSEIFVEKKRIIVHPVVSVEVTILCDIESNTSKVISTKLLLNSNNSNELQKCNDLLLDLVEEYITNLLDGKMPNFEHNLPLLFHTPSFFTYTVLSSLLLIPLGTVYCYSDLAKLAGHDGAIRAAATALSKNPLPLLVPCHRVVTKDLRIGGFMGVKIGPEVALKRTLLKLEGINWITP